MNKNITGLFLFMLLILTSCASENSSSYETKYDGYTVKGTTANFPPGTPVRLQRVVGRKTTPVDTSSVKADGSFEMKGTVDEKGFAQLMIGSNQAFLILDNYPINIDIDRNNARTYNLSGSKEMNVLQSLTDKMSSGVLNENKDFIRSFVDTVGSTHLAYVAMQYLKPDSDMDVYEKVESRFKKELPGNPLGEQLSQYIAQTKQKAEAGKKTAVGALAPNIDLPNPDGESMRLDDLKGKVVLVDFWASWCGPCRRENPHVVELYNKYKSQGFEVYSVSLDSRKERWVKAIEQDGLVWDSHVSDLKKWSSAPAALYGVRSIPTTFLIDKDGKIIAKNLRGAELTAKLQEIFG